MSSPPIAVKARSVIALLLAVALGVSPATAYSVLFHAVLGAGFQLVKVPSRLGHTDDGAVKLVAFG